MITITDELSDIIGYQPTGPMLLILPEGRDRERSNRQGAVWAYNFKAQMFIGEGLDF